MSSFARGIRIAIYSLSASSIMRFFRTYLGISLLVFFVGSSVSASEVSEHRLETLISDLRDIGDFEYVHNFGDGKGRSSHEVFNNYWTEDGILFLVGYSYSRGAGLFSSDGEFEFREIQAIPVAKISGVRFYCEGDSSVRRPRTCSLYLRTSDRRIAKRSFDLREAVISISGGSRVPKWANKDIDFSAGGSMSIIFLEEDLYEVEQIMEIVEQIIERNGH